jgi:streptogramin lyase
VTDFLSELRGELLDGLERYERAPWWRRPVRIAPAARRIVAVAAAAAAVAAAVVVADRPVDDERGATPPVSRLEGFHSAGAAVDGNTLWVTEYNSSALLRVDLRTGHIDKRIDVGGSPGTVIVAAGAIWVEDWERGRLVKVDPRTARVTKALDLGSTAGDIAFAAGSVWVIGERGILIRVDPKTATVTRRVPLRTDGASPALTAYDGTLWVNAGSAIIKLDAGTAKEVGRTQGPFLPLEFARRAAADADGLWISSPTRREVVHVDARTLRLTRHAVGGDTNSVAVVDHRVWVATVHDDDPLTRISVLDADGRLVGTMAVPHPAVGIVPSPSGGAWVTFGEDATVSPAAVHLSSP